MPIKEIIDYKNVYFAASVYFFTRTVMYKSCQQYSVTKQNGSHLIFKVWNQCPVVSKNLGGLLNTNLNPQLVLI